MSSMMDPNPYPFLSIGDSWTWPDPQRRQEPYQDTPEERHAFCLRELLPIWERWTDGNQALRRYLECGSADADRYPDRLRVLIETANELSRRGGKAPSVKAALASVLACLAAHRGVPKGEWDQAGGHALLMDMLALGELRRMQEGREA